MQMQVPQPPVPPRPMHFPVQEDGTLASSGPIRALVLDDSNFDRRNLIRACEKGGLAMQFDQIASLAELDERLEDNAYDLFFIDYLLADGTGLEAINKILGHPSHAGSATIMIAGQGDVDVAVSAIKTGCSDYIEKSNMSPNAIRRAVTNALQKARLVQEVNEANGFKSSVQRVLEKFALDCKDDMKPVLSRMLREIRSMRGAGPSEQSAEVLEKSCQELWDFLGEIQDYAARIR